MEKKAKIIATLGPSIYSENKLNKIINLGVDAFRVNFSHNTKGIKKIISKIRKISSNKIYASIGPCIGENNYEVDLKFYKKFLSKSKKNVKYFKRKNKFKKLFNLRLFIKDKLKRLRIDFDNVNHDTFKERDNFFSYRRSSILKEKDYGRCISVIKIN